MRAAPAPSPWPLALAGLGLLAGMALLQGQAALPGWPWIALVAALGAGLGVLARRCRLAGAMALALGAGLLLGGSWAALRAQLRLSEALEPAWEGRELTLTVRVDGLPSRIEGFAVAGWRLPLTRLDVARSAQGEAVTLPQHVSVGWFLDETPPRAGETWRLTLRAQRVHLPRNPGLPDAEFWLLERNVRALGTVRAGERVRSAAPWHLHAWRQQLREAIEARVHEPRARAVLTGLLIGEQGALAAADWALLRDTGVVHLFSISGLHITGLAWAVGLLVGQGWRRSARLCAAWPAPWAARTAALAAALAYALLAGWGVPAQRTVGLLVVLALLAASGRHWPWPLALVLAGAAVALGDPWATVQSGFWLSFVAVAVLMADGQRSAAAQGLARGTQALRALLRTQLRLTLALLPLSLLFFGSVSLVGLLANVLAVPLVTLLLVPLTLAGALLPPLWTLAAALVAPLWALLAALQAWPLAVWHAAQAPWPWVTLALVGMALAVLRAPRRWRWLGLLGLVPLLAWSPARPPQGAFRLRILDVGQGSAVWLQTARHDALIDTGPRWGQSDAGARWLLPLLRAQGVRGLDLLAISHADADHSGGALSVAAALPVAQVVGQLPGGHALAARASPCEAGRSWTWDGVRLRWLHPPPGWQAPTPNAGSCVLHIESMDGRTALLPADIGAREEQVLLARTPGLRAELLLLAHHGSASSSTEAFLDALSPQLAFAQAGYRSRHGHPALIVRQRLAARQIPLLTSAACGAFDWHSALGPPATGTCERSRRPRYWQQPAEPWLGEDAPPGPEPPPLLTPP